jgi:hypothetical protein
LADASEFERTSGGHPGPHRRCHVVIWATPAPPRSPGVTPSSHPISFTGALRVRLRGPTKARTDRADQGTGDKLFRGFIRPRSVANKTSVRRTDSMFDRQDITDETDLADAGERSPPTSGPSQRSARSPWWVQSSDRTRTRGSPGLEEGHDSPGGTLPTIGWRKRVGIERKTSLLSGVKRYHRGSGQTLRPVDLIPVSPLLARAIRTKSGQRTCEAGRPREDSRSPAPCETRLLALPLQGGPALARGTLTKVQVD